MALCSGESLRERYRKPRSLVEPKPKRPVPWTGLFSRYGLALHIQQFDVEHQRRVRRDHTASATGAVTQRGRNDQRALAADFHGGDAFVPARDHLALSDRKFERLITVDRRVEFLALLAVLI